MSEQAVRMTDRDHPPSDAEVAAWMGDDAHRYWHGGKKHEWALRYKKSKPLCTLAPEKGRCALLVVFGAEERARVEAIRGELSQGTLAAYDAATAYHDGKWLLLTVDSDETVQDVTRLWAAKRKPKGELQTKGGSI